MKRENMYDFRKKLLTVHESNVIDTNRQKKANEYMLENKAVIKISENAGEVIKTAANDFVDFLKTSMSISACVTPFGENASITVALAEDTSILGEAEGYKGFKACVDENGVEILAFDERGAAQALYYIEDMMTLEKAPVLSYGEVKKKPLFSPQMVHSGYGLDEYPDEYLSRIAHEGRDAILVFTKGLNEVPTGYLDFNDLIKRAGKYGIDVYAYSYIVSNISPDSPEAEEFFENSYGKLFKNCPKLKGVTLVGESVEFPSKDPHVAKGRYFETATDGIPSDKPSSGWYPCYDYPEWLNLLKKSVRKYNPEADIVFWTYNWGYQPEEARLKLIESLPADISLQATFEMFHQTAFENSMGRCADYTLSFEGYGKYFESEAKAAKKRGIKLYSMTNTGGKTWDFGTVPYQPMPYQWIKRYKAMLKAHDEWGLSGIMESHHYGFYPSIISKLSKYAFSEPREDMEEILKKVLISAYGKENLEKTIAALKHLSDGISFYTPSDADQYGAYRIGPSYPFNLSANTNIPAYEGAMFGNCIINPIYHNESDDRMSPLAIRINDEIARQKKMLEHFNEGVRLLKEAPSENEKLNELINLCEFLVHCTVTGLNAKKWHVLKCKMNVCDDKKEFGKILNEMEELLKCEIKNAEETIPIVEADSMLGFEPSMLYMTDKWHIEWKIRQVNYVINTEIKKLKEAIKL